MSGLQKMVFCYITWSFSTSWQNNENHENKFFHNIDFAKSELKKKFASSRAGTLKMLVYKQRCKQATSLRF